MSEENVELVRAIYEAWGAGRSAREYVAEDIEYVNPRNAVETGTRLGYSSLVSVFDVYPDFRVEVERIIDAGDAVVVIGTAHGTGASGLGIHMRQGYVWTIEDGRAVRFRWFTDPAEAFEAAGVGE
jgi:ketosteroid isomerase-like protein